MYIFSVAAIEMFDVLKKEKPTTSIRAYLSTLEQISSRANRVCVLHFIINNGFFSMSTMVTVKLLPKDKLYQYVLCISICPRKC